MADSPELKGKIVPTSCKISHEETGKNVFKIPTVGTDKKGNKTPTDGTDENGNKIPAQIHECYVKMKHLKTEVTRKQGLTTSEGYKVAAAVKPALRHADDISIDTLPSAVVSKFIKDCVPPSCRISHEADTAIRKAATVFVLFATSSASAVAKKNSRRTITGPDVLKAMEIMEFNQFVEPLEHSLMSWNSEKQEKKAALYDHKGDDEAARKNVDKIDNYGDKQNVIEID